MTDHRSRRWFQLSLRSLFGLTLLMATFFGGYTLAMKQSEKSRRDDKEALTAAEQARDELEAALLDARRRPRNYIVPLGIPADGETDPAPVKNVP